VVNKDVHYYRKITAVCDNVRNDN